MQCDQIFRNVANLAQSQNSWVYLAFGEILVLLWQKCFTIGQVFIVVDVQILKII